MKRGTLIAILVTVGVLVLGGGAGLTWKLVSDHQKTVEAEQQAQDEADAEAQRIQDEENANEMERTLRKVMVPDIEDSIKTMAEGHVDDGVLDGPIISVTCSPVNGGSTDNLDEATTVFECFAANVDNGDGTMSGYTYNATMNWDTGQYTYGLGAP